MFEQDNFATNTFDVLIQLGKIHKRRNTRKSHLNDQATKDEEMINNQLNNNAIIVSNRNHCANDDINTNLNVKDVPTPTVNDMKTDDGLQECIDDMNDDNISHVKTSQNRNGELNYDELVATSMSDIFQVKHIDENNNSADLNELQSDIESTSHDILRKETNAMKEGYRENDDHGSTNYKTLI